MKNSAVKRMIAVLLCLVVFAGSELTGLTNIVGSLAATDTVEIAEPEYDEPTETLDLQAEEESAEPEASEPAEETPETSAPEEEAPAPEESGDAGTAAGQPEEGSESGVPAEEGTNTEQTADAVEKAEAETASGGETEAEANTENEEQKPSEAEVPETNQVQTEVLEETENLYPEFEDRYSDDKVEIHVSAEEGVLPEGVALSVTPIVKQDVEELETQEEITQEEIDLAKEVNEKYDATAEKLEETVAEDDTKNIAGFLAYDISFWLTETDKETGEETQTEIEPNGNVSVTMDFSDGYLPEELAEDENVSIASVDVVHMKEEDGDIQPEVLTDAAVDTTEKAEVKTAEFTVDSFSTFVIMWGDFAYIAAFQLVTMGGVDITGISNGTINLPLDDDYTFNVEDIAQDEKLKHLFTVREGEEEYTYVKAEIAGIDSPPSAAIAEIRKGNGVMEWRRTGSRDWENNGSTVVAVNLFYSKDSIKEVPSIDSASKGVRLFMKDYPFDSYLMNELLGKGQDDAKQGLVRPVLTNGFPVVSQNGESLSRWFEDGKEVNGLFRKDKFDNEGIFYYSCFENYAYLGEGDEFTLYDQVGTPEKTQQITGEGSKIYVNRGNFFPYNKIVEGEFSTARELYDENGNYYRDENGEPLYEGTGRQMYLIQPKEGEHVLDFHFSMRLETDFVQGTDGLYRDNPMIYQFNGDDDLWVFIDDVLVLDIGGNHPARSGSINFATGEVIVNQTSGPVRTTIKECFDRAAQYCTENGIEKTISNEWEEYEPGHFRFEDNSGHTLKMFYMERNHAEKDGGSNLKVSFNLPTIDADKIRVRKELTGTAQKQYANVDFDFRVWLKNSSGGYEALTTSAKDDDGNPIAVDPETGIFHLKQGQSAWFSDLPVNAQYYVEEIGYGKAGSDYTVEETSYEECNTTDQTGVSVTGTKTDDKSVKDRKHVIFTNKCSENVKNDLQITKRMNGNSSGQGPFTIKVWLEDRTGVLVPYTGVYEVDGREKSTSDGTMLLSVDETASIRDLVAGTAFYVEELNLDLSVYEEADISPVSGTYEADSCQSAADEAETVRTAQGAITKGKDAQVIVTNALKGGVDGGLQITKRMKEGSEAAEGEKAFRFEILLEKESGKPEAYTGPYTLDGEKQSGSSDGIITIPVDGSVVIDAIPGGTKYTIREILTEDNLYAQPEIETRTGKETTVSMNSSTAEGTITAGIYTYITVSNIRKPEPAYSYDWQIVKKGTSEEGHSLAGAMFTLVRKTDGNNPEKTYYGRSRKDTGILVWYDSEEDAEKENSPVERSQMEPGTYTLKETKAPTGYVLSNETWTIVLAYDGITVNGKEMRPGPEKPEGEKQLFEYVFTNEAAYELPSTGGTGIFGYMISGTLLMMAGILILYKRKFAGRC